MKKIRKIKKESQKHALVVDENFTYRYFLTKALRAHGYGCVEAEDYQRAHPYIKKNIFDIVLVDVSTFMKSGMASFLNGSCPKTVTPTIFLIEQATDEVMENAQRLGAWAIFEKRGDLNDLLEKIKPHFKKEWPRP